MFLRTGNGLAATEGEGDAKDDGTAGFVPAAGGEAVGAIDGLAFGVPLILGLDDGAEEAGLEVAFCAEGLAPGVEIGFAATGVFRLNSVTVSFIASVIGILTTPLVLSTHAYVVSALPVSERIACNFSARALARFSSYVSPRGDAPMTTSASSPKNAKRSTIPIQVENMERD